MGGTGAGLARLGGGCGWLRACCREPGLAEPSPIDDTEADVGGLVGCGWLDACFGAPAAAWGLPPRAAGEAFGNGEDGLSCIGRAACWPRGFAAGRAIMAGGGIPSCV